VLNTANDPRLFGIASLPTRMNKKALTERDICTKFITPALVKAGWDVQTQIREEVNLTKGRVIVLGRTYKRGEAKRADYLSRRSNWSACSAHARNTCEPCGNWKRNFTPPPEPSRKP